MQSCLSRSAEDRKALLLKSQHFFELYQESRSNYPETLYNLGRFYAGIGEFIRAIKLWEECVTECCFQENNKVIMKKAAYNL